MSTTLGIYTHLYPSRQNEIANKFRKFCIVLVRFCHVFHVPAVYLSCTRGKNEARKSLIYKDFRESGNYSHSTVAGGLPVTS